jgi:hypothetical protein
VILDDSSGRPPTAALVGEATLDDLFGRALARHPDAVALIDPPNRAAVTGQSPRRLTYAQADRAISRLAGRLRRIGLSSDAIVGFQTANTVESVVTLLAVLRAGLIAMPLPLLWRRADAAAVLGRVGATGLLVSARVGKVDHCDIAMQVAGDVFALRHVCAFGTAPDGVLALDDVFTETAEPPPRLTPDLPRLAPSAHLAVITCDVAVDGLIPVARSHAELIAGGLATMLEGDLAPDSAILSTVMSASFAGLATSVLPWLLTGGALALHHPFDLPSFDAQVAFCGCATVVVPGPLGHTLAEAGHFAGSDTLKTVLAVWRAPERLARAPLWESSSVALVDVQAFGEIGVIAARREIDGKPAPIAFGMIDAPRRPPGGSQGSPQGSHASLHAGEIRASATGSLAMRGPMVPRAAFPAGAERTSLPHLRVARDSFVDTGYACQAGNGPMVVTAPPPGIVSVGGYRFVAQDLQAIVAQVDRDGTLAALPDALAGHRLAGSVSDERQVRQALEERGVNPLLAGAFGSAPPRPPPQLAKAS